MTSDESQSGGGKRMDRRDRLERSYCEDEPVNPDRAYQLILNRAYALKNSDRISKVYSLLAQNANLPKLPYQAVRTEYLLGEYYRALDSELDRQGVPARERELDFLGIAADHYARGAGIARQIPDTPDWALVAQLKLLEAKVCFFSHPRCKRFGRAFTAAKAALDTWHKLPDRKNTNDMIYGFELGDTLGVYGQMVAQDEQAVRGLDYAAQKLFEQQDRSDIDLERYANDELFLDWDWTSLYYSMAHYRHAFKMAILTRKKGHHLFTDQNRARFQWLIASIMLACVEEGQVGAFSRQRLLAASARAIDEGYHWVETCKKNGKEDRAAYAMILLADTKLMGLMSRRRDVKTRVAKIEEAQEIAAARDDILLQGQVETAWGDEYTLQYVSQRTRGKKAAAEDHYQRAIGMLEEVEAFSLARIARWRLERFRNPPPRQSLLENQKNQGNPPSDPRMPRPDFDPSHN